MCRPGNVKEKRHPRGKSDDVRISEQFDTKEFVQLSLFPLTFLSLRFDDRIKEDSDNGLACDWLPTDAQELGSAEEGRRKMFMIHYRSVSWWYWLLTAGFLTAGVFGWSTGFLLAILLVIIQLIHFAILEQSLTAFPVQVRLGYLLLLLFAAPEPLQWIYWIPTVGTWAQVIVGYCAMARTVSLLPWNRSESFSLDLLKRTFLTPPTPGNILQGLPPAHSGK
jgi:hypothetical protein